MENLVDVVAFFRSLGGPVGGLALLLLSFLTVAYNLFDLNGFDSRFLKSVFVLLIVLENVFGLEEVFLFETDIGTRQFEGIF